MGDDDERARREAADIEADRALGQTLADAIEKAGIAHDAARAEAAAFLEPWIAKAKHAITAGDYEEAAKQFEAVSYEYRVRGLRGDADQWEHRAADCRSAGRHAKRLKKKGRSR